MHVCHVLISLYIAVELGVKRLLVYGDSTLVINQVNKDWSCTSDKMDAYCLEIRTLEGRTKQLTSYPS